jgi:hypothetical protein
MNEQELYQEISSIRSIMERSTKFISLSGLSGVLAGLYALAGSFIAFRMIYSEEPVVSRYQEPLVYYWPLFLVALAVFLLSLITGVLLGIRKAKKKGERFWNLVTRRMIVSIAIPLFTGGMLIAILLLRGEYFIIAPLCLIFYGLALVAGSQYTFTDLKWLGFCEIGLGLVAALFPGYGLVLWSAGFGLLHILYGSIMHVKYDR